jgi:O-methyltransferase involved in polyketide biosynthesis
VLVQRKENSMSKPEWLTEEEADSLCSNVHALLKNDALTAFLKVDVLSALQSERAEVVVERLDTGEPVFRVTTRGELQNWVRLFDQALHEFKAAAAKQVVLEMERGKE